MTTAPGIAGLRGLYAITPDAAASPPGRPGAAPLAERVAQAIAGGARLVQYRDKTADRERRRAEAGVLADLCRRSGVPFVVNDDLDLALAVAADGVHLGRDDPDPGLARRRLGPRAIVGVSCYDRLELGLAAEAAGASYAAFGSFFPSPTKPLAVRPPLDLLTRARARLSIPLVAIGGITPENARLLIAAGADLVAVASGVFAAPDILQVARAYSHCFEPGERPPEDSR